MRPIVITALFVCFASFITGIILIFDQNIQNQPCQSLENSTIFSLCVLLIIECMIFCDFLENIRITPDFWLKITYSVIPIITLYSLAAEELILLLQIPISRDSCVVNFIMIISFNLTGFLILAFSFLNDLS